MKNRDRTELRAEQFHNGGYGDSKSLLSRGSCLNQDLCRLPQFYFISIFYILSIQRSRVSSGIVS